MDLSILQPSSMQSVLAAQIGTESFLQRPLACKRIHDGKEGFVKGGRARSRSQDRWGPASQAQYVAPVCLEGGLNLDGSGGVQKIQHQSDGQKSNHEYPIHYNPSSTINTYALGKSDGFPSVSSKKRETNSR
jgi:hypothetical protein